MYVTPGIRPAGNAKDDQSRVATPLQAKEWGSTAIVVGRPITLATDPEAAYEAIKGVQLTCIKIKLLVN